MRSVLFVADSENEAHSTMRTFAFPGWDSIRFRRSSNLRLLMNWYFLQDPRVAIRVAEVDILHAP